MSTSSRKATVLASVKVADLDLFTPWLGRCALVFAGLSAAGFMEDDEQKPLGVSDIECRSRQSGDFQLSGSGFLLVILHEPRGRQSGEYQRTASQPRREQVEISYLHARENGRFP